MDDITDLIPLPSGALLEGELPPLPPIPSPEDPQFGQKILIRQAVQSMHSTAAVQEQTEQMGENVEAVNAAVDAITAGNTAMAAPTTEAEVWLRAMLCQLSADQHGADHLNTIRNRLGINWMVAMSDQVAAAYVQRFLRPAPPPA
jgi:hypothetical protein